MSKAKVLPGGGYVNFNHMTWPLPGERMGELEQTLRYSTPTVQDQMYAASIVSAYRQLVADPETKRRIVIRELRDAVGKTVGKD